MKKNLHAFVLGCLLFFSPAAIYSNDFIVNVTTDGNATNQLRGAIAAADAAGSGPHTITLAAGTYNLTMGQIMFGADAIALTITGAGAGSTIINMMAGPNQDRILMINPSGTVSNVHVTIEGITFTGGHLRSDNFGGGAILCGGPNNTVTIRNCVFNNNTIDVTAGTNGGALAMEGGGILIVDQCTFSNNAIATGDAGALFYFLPGSQSGSLNVTNSVFTNNSVTDLNSNGGAIGISIQGTVGGTHSTVSILRNTFTANHANATGGSGGAIVVSNGFAVGNTALVNYNRFVGNTATNTATSGVEMLSTAGSVDVNNNWWGCNNGPISGTGCDRAAVSGSSGAGTLIANNWLQLHTAASAAFVCSGANGNTATITTGFLTNSAGAAVSPTDLFALTGVAVGYTQVLGSISGAQTTIQSTGTATATFTSNGTVGPATVNTVVDNVPNNDALARASVAVKASPVINTQPSPHAICTGEEVTFNVAASGSSLSYAWYRNTTALVDGPTLSDAIISGATTSGLTISNPGTAEGATSYNVQVTSGGCTTISNFTQLTVAPLVLASTNSGGNTVISSTNTAISNGSCSRIAVVQPSGADPVSNLVSATVTIDAGQPVINNQPYVRRHYDIAPSVNTNFATATITLYFLQSEFDSYNAVMPGTISDLPVDANDVTGRSNLRVTQFHGFGTNPANYTGWGGVGPAAVLINPGGGNVVWNATRSWWEVTFPVTGFSGFFITGLINFPLPVTIEQLTATKEASAVLVHWQVSREVNFSHYEVETGSDGRNFVSIGSVDAANTTDYRFVHNSPVNGLNYYRLKLVDIDGHAEYSKIVSCLFGAEGFSVQVLNNPFAGNLVLRIGAHEDATLQLRLTDAAGKLVTQRQVAVSKGGNTVTVPVNVTRGMYLLRVSGEGFVQTIKVIKSQ